MTKLVNTILTIPLVTGNLIVPLKLKYPVLKLVDYPEATLVGLPFNVTLSVELPPLFVNYKVSRVLCHWKLHFHLKFEIHR